MPLGGACRCGRSEMVEVLVKRGALVEEPNAEPLRRRFAPAGSGMAGLDNSDGCRPSQLNCLALLAKISTNHVICIHASDRVVPLSANPGILISAGLVVGLFGEWRSCDEVREIWRCEPLNVSNAKIPKNVVNRRPRFLTNDVAKASFKSVLECQPRKCG